MARVSSPYHHGFSMMTSNNKPGGKPTIVDVHGISTKSAPLRFQVKANAKETKNPNLDPFASGGLMVEDGSVFRRTFAISSYETGPDRKASIETVMNHFQETFLNYGKTVGLLGDGFDSTPKLCKNLIWVMTKTQVEVDRYPTWGDVVEIDVCISPLGKTRVRCDWLFRDCTTAEILIRGSSNLGSMNKVTRRLLKFSDEIQARLDEYFVDKPPIVVVTDSRKLGKLDETSTADHVCSGSKPRWTDLDANYHVNNVKYISWILESTPEPIVMNYELAAITLEYLRECGKDCVLQALTCLLPSDDNGTADVDYQHVIRLENGCVMMKGWTRWRPKYGKISQD